MKNIIARGAEAIIYIEDNKLIKERLPKPYRLQDIDNTLRKIRTRREAKLIEKAAHHVPKIYHVDDKQMKISMEYIDGDLLRDSLDTFSPEKQQQLMNAIGKIIAQLHAKDIIHGDITTSNIILKPDMIYFIDFGLGVTSKRIEDKAVDLYLFKHSLESKHYEHMEKNFQAVLQGYKEYSDHDDVLKRLETVGTRGRYKRKIQNL